MDRNKSRSQHITLIQDKHSNNDQVISNQNQTHESEIISIDINKFEENK